MKKEFTISTKVLSVSGHQFWTVKAEDEAEALALFAAGEGDHQCDEIEVIDIGEPRIVSP